MKGLIKFLENNFKEISEVLLMVVYLILFIIPVIIILDFLNFGGISLDWHRAGPGGRIYRMKDQTALSAAKDKLNNKVKKRAFKLFKLWIVVYLMFVGLIQLGVRLPARVDFGLN